MQNKQDGVAFNKRINLVDTSTGKSVYNNSDVVDMAAFSVKRCGTGFEYPKIEFSSINIRCTNCGSLKSRFLNQINGFWCYDCNNASRGLGITLNDEQAQKIAGCGKSSGRTDDQANCVGKILKNEIESHNRKYRYLPNGEPTILHKIIYKLTPFINGQVILFKELFND